MDKLKPATTKSKAPPALQKKSAAVKITPIQLNRIAQDGQTRKEAVAEAELAYFPFRYKLQRMFLNTADNGHIKACMERRKDLTLLRKFEITDTEGNIDEDTALIFCNKQKRNLVPKGWFIKAISYALDALFYGFSLVHLGDIMEGEFKDLKIVKRWHVSPDRYQVTSFPYLFVGDNFMTDEALKDWYLYVDTPNDIGTSPCGYGILYDISIHEIFLRNLLGFNGSFVELFSQPFRWGKTTKTEESERAEFAAMLENIGSSGWGIGDLQDEVEFKETALGGTGYKGYDNLEARLQKIISKVILGHGDALDSVPGKLGAGQGEDSPTAQALRDKQTKDGGFIENIINDILFPKLRNLGFNIPLDRIFTYKNDAEVADNANNLAGLSGKMLLGGLQMSPEYFTEQTGIPAEIVQKAAPPIAKPGIPPSDKVVAKLKKLYK